MSQLTLLVLQLGFLALLWVMVLSVVGVLRRDLYGTRVVTRKPRRRGRNAAPQTPPRGRAAVPPRTATPNAPGRLVITAGSLVGTTLSLGQAPVLIGRAPECTLVLTDDFASSRHAKLTPGADGWTVEDLGSTNGTTLNGAPLGGPTPVAAGAVLKIGRTVIELRR
ncbi:MAG: FHA domain-containing protein [Actinomycetales bacterium]